MHGLPSMLMTGGGVTGQSLAGRGSLWLSFLTVLSPRCFGSGVHPVPSVRTSSTLLCPGAAKFSFDQTSPSKTFLDPRMSTPNSQRSPSWSPMAKARACLDTSSPSTFSSPYGDRLRQRRWRTGRLIPSHRFARRPRRGDPENLPEEKCCLGGHGNPNLGIWIRRRHRARGVLGQQYRYRGTVRQVGIRILESPLRWLCPHTPTAWHLSRADRGPERRQALPRRRHFAPHAP